MSNVINREHIFMQIRNQIGHSGIVLKYLQLTLTDHIQGLVGAKNGPQQMFVDRLSQRTNKNVSKCQYERITTQF